MKETKRMSAAQRRARQRKQRNRRIAMTVALVLVVALASIGGTIAWLTATTGSVVNTFTVGDVDITLTETNATDLDGDGDYEKEFHIVPNVPIAKDPKVTIDTDSEKCWVFVKVKVENWPTYTYTDAEQKAHLKVSYEIDSAWKKLEGATGVAEGETVYYMKVDAPATCTTPFSILANDQVVVSETLTKNEANSIGTGVDAPKLTFTAYAIQQDGVNQSGNNELQNALLAWSKINPTT